MGKLLMIPDINDLEGSIRLANKYDLGFEYNDFYYPDVLDDDDELEKIVATYKSCELPQYTTVHGAFYDVIPFSIDEKIRDISHLRIEQSIETSKKIGAKAVVFHTNYNPFLSSKEYVRSFIDINVEFWSEILKEHFDINIYLENMFDTSPYIMEQLAKRLCKYENFGICFDYAHAKLSNVSIIEWAKSLGEYVKHVHINDNDGVSDLHLALGDGILEREEFYNCYREYFNEATVLIEMSNIDSVKKSIEILIKEGFITYYE